MRHAACAPLDATTTAASAPTSPSARQAGRLAVLAAVALLATGCVFPPTLAEEFARERWQRCARDRAGLVLERIDCAGGIAYHYTQPAAPADVDRCLDALAERQMMRVLAPAPPAPVATPLAAAPR